MQYRLTLIGTASQLAAALHFCAEQGMDADVGNDMPAPAPAPAPPMPAAIPPMPANPGGDEADHDAPDAAPDPNAPVTDTAGYPWDERIHAKTKATVADGTWRKKRGVAPELVATVEAELRNVQVAEAIPPAPAPVAPPVPAAPIPPVAAPVPAAPVPAAIPPVAPVPPVAPPVPAPVAPAAPAPSPVIDPAVPLDFAGFMAHIAVQMAKRLADGTPMITADYLGGITQEIATAFQTTLNAITDIATNPQMITYAAQCIDRDQRWN